MSICASFIYIYSYYVSKTKCKLIRKTITVQYFSVCQKLAWSCKKWKSAKKAIHALLARRPSILNDMNVHHISQVDSSDENQNPKFYRNVHQFCSNKLVYLQLCPPHLMSSSCPISCKAGNIGFLVNNSPSIHLKKKQN